MIKYQDLLTSDNFRDALTAKKLCLFLGAGVARNINMPDWNGLAINIANFCFHKKIFNHSTLHTLLMITEPLKIISYCIQKVEEKSKSEELKKFFEEIFCKNPLTYYDQHNTLYKYFSEIYKTGKVLLVQTNYDSVIEESIRKSKMTIQPYIPYNDANIELSNNLLVYLHGKYTDNYNDIVLTKQKYNEVYVLQNEKNQEYEKQKYFFKNLLENYSIVILGYSLQDNEIIQLIANRKNVESYKTINIIIDNCKAKEISNAIDEKYWRESCNDNINIYTYDIEKKGYAAFKKVISNLKKEICKSVQQDIITLTDPSQIEDLDDYI